MSCYNKINSAQTSKSSPLKQGQRPNLFKKKSKQINRTLDNYHRQLIPETQLTEYIETPISTGEKQSVKINRITCDQLEMSKIEEK